MKKIALITAAIMLMAGAASAASIVNSKHDLSSTSTGTSYTGATNQICIYCHTPHNAQVAVPLWNRTYNPAIASGTTLYYSNTLTNAAATASITGSSISSFCLSCHDGTTSLANVRNAVGQTLRAGTLDAANTNLGTLTNDHPIGFSYTAAQAADAGLVAAASHAVGTLPLFSGAADTLECASCHAVHDPANGYFLRASNAGSALCLTCHAK